MTHAKQTSNGTYQTKDTTILWGTSLNPWFDSIEKRARNRPWHCCSTKSAGPVMEKSKSMRKEVVRRIGPDKSDR
jgi:hypothetical protein